MAYVEIQGKNIYYEEYGKGEVVVFLNGIMMSTGSWSVFTDIFSENYKLLYVDLIDQGRSDKADNQYTQDMHVEILMELFKKLGYNEINLFGVSYGGEVAQLFTLKYGHMIKSLILANTTSYTNKSMQDLEKAWDYAASTYDASTFFNVTMPSIYSYKFYEKNIEWLKEREKQFDITLDKAWYDGFRRAAKSANNLNITDRLHEINVPTMIISSELDTITPVEYQQVLYKNIPNARWTLIKDAGHASMYEKPYEFASILLGFLKTVEYEIEIV